MTILGIDPGLNATGYGVIATERQSLRLVAAGTVRPRGRQPLAGRLQELYEGLTQIIETTRPSLTVLESLFIHHQFLTTAALMAHARSVALLVSAQHALRVVEYLPTRVKKALTGHGAATKDQVARAVGGWLGIDAAACSHDATDALALAITHAHVDRVGARLTQHDGIRTQRKTGRRDAAWREAIA